MTTKMDSFYRLTVKDAFRAGEAMAEAFVDDPVWEKLFEGESDLPTKYQAFFEIPIRHCIKFGKVYAISEKLEGLAAFVPGNLADMSFVRFVRSGSLGCSSRMGMTAGRRMAKLKFLGDDRKEHTKGKPFIYLQLLGVQTSHQGKGLGSSLLRALIADCDAQELPIYLETETEENVQLYEHFGFKQIKKVTLEDLGMPMWEMIREPNAGS